MKIEMLFNKKYIYILFLFYGALLFTQDDNCMTIPAVLCAHPLKHPIYPINNSQLQQARLHNPNHQSKTLAPIPHNNVSFILNKIFNFNLPKYTLPIKSIVPVNSNISSDDTNQSCFSISSIMEQHKNATVFEEKEVKILLFLLLVMKSKPNQEEWLNDKNGTIIIGKGDQGDLKNIPLSITPINTAIPMNLNIMRIKPLHYKPEVVARIMEKNSFFCSRYKTLQKEHNKIKEELQKLKKEKKELEQNIAKAQEEYKKLEQINDDNAQQKKSLQENITLEKQKYTTLENNLKNKIQEYDKLNQEYEKLKKETKTQQDTVKNLYDEKDTLEKRYNEIENTLNATGKKLRDTEQELTNAKENIARQAATIKQEQEEKVTLLSEKERLNSSYTILKGKYDDQTASLNHMREEHAKLNASFDTIKKLIDDDNKEEFEKLKKNVEAFEKSLAEISNEDKEMLTKIVEEKNSIETQWQKHMTELEEKHKKKLEKTIASYTTKLKEKSTDIENLNTTNNRLQSNNTMLTAGLLIACILFCLENIYYKNKITKLTLLLAQ